MTKTIYAQVKIETQAQIFWQVSMNKKILCLCLVSVWFTLEYGPDKYFAVGNVPHIEQNMEIINKEDIEDRRIYK